MLECALYAPTGGNLQNSRFLMIQDPRLLEKLNTVIRDELAAREIAEGEMMAKGIRRARQEGYHFIFRAPTLICAAAPRYHSNSMANCCTGLENICWLPVQSAVEPAGATSRTGLQMFRPCGRSFSVWALERTRISSEASAWAIQH